MKRKIAGLLGALSVGAVAVLGSGATAQAQPREGDVGATGLACSGLTFCLYEHDDYSGDRIRLSYNENVSNLASADYKFDNKASSMSNNTSVQVTLHQLKGYSGTRYTARKLSQDSDFSNNGFDNKASSVRIG